MLVVSLFVVLSFIIGYIIYVLTWTENQERHLISIDNYIIQLDENDEEIYSYDPLAKYCTHYITPGKQILILYGTEYGFAEEIARKLFDKLTTSAEHNELCIQPRIVSAQYYDLIDFYQENVLVCIMSTTGDGVPPTSSRSFLTMLDSLNSLSHASYCVLALGDSTYPHFCKAGKTLDKLLLDKGGKSIVSRVDIDQEDWMAINKWMLEVSNALLSIPLTIHMDYLDLTKHTDTAGYSRTNPWMATLKEKYSLTKIIDEDDKETIHCVFDIAGSGLTYTAGDALGIYPLNDPTEVDAIIHALHCNGNESVTVPSWGYAKVATNKISLKDALMTYYDLKTVKSELVQAVLDSIQEKTKMTEKVFHQLLVQYEVIDLLNNLPLHKCSVSTFLSHLRPLQPRHYSIASSPQKSHDQVSLCIAVVRYTLNGTARTGVCTTYIQDRLSIGSRVPVFISQNPEFRLPLDPQTPIIMIGPGTGIAPFRAFLQERTIATNGTNNNTLYFGCRHKNKDYLYQNELEHCAINGYLLLRTAFSRDQLNKVYVQNLLWEDKEMIWKLLQVGAYVYVCGDAKYMARDVNQTLINIISTHNDDPHMYMKHLESEGRYQRDVWVV